MRKHTLRHTLRLFLLVWPRRQVKESMPQIGGSLTFATMHFNR